MMETGASAAAQRATPAQTRRSARALPSVRTVLIDPFRDDTALGRGAELIRWDTTLGPPGFLTAFRLDAGGPDTYSFRPQNLGGTFLGTKE